MKTIVFTFGRMNPPTKGHELVINKLVETAKLRGCEHVVYLSQSNNNKTDPLEWNFKRRVCETAFPGVNISKDISIRNPYIALETLKESYDNVVMVVGSDQAEEFTKRFSSYADKWNIHFEVISAGQRIVESEGVAGLSGTKMRQYAAEDNKKKFFEGLPGNLNSALRELVFKNTKKGLVRNN